MFFQGRTGVMMSHTGWTWGHLTVMMLYGCLHSNVNNNPMGYTNYVSFNEYNTGIQNSYTCLSYVVLFTLS